MCLQEYGFGGVTAAAVEVGLVYVGLVCEAADVSIQHAVNGMQGFRRSVV